MTKGLDLCLQNLTKLEAKAPKVAREAVNEVAQEFKKELEVNTPVSDELTLTRLKEDIRISNFKGEEMLLQKILVLVVLLVGVLSFRIAEQSIRKHKTLRKRLSMQLLLVLKKYTNKK